MLLLKDLTVTVGKKTILKNINFSFKKGKIYAVMGPNGSGKTTLAYTIMGHPSYKPSRRSRILLNGTDLKKLKPDKRAKKGIFLSFQTPSALSGVSVNQLLQMVLRGKKDVIQIRKEIKNIAEKLQINEDLLNRSLNRGASGGEKKKMEVLQAGVINSPLIIFDEVDTGVDVDALKLIADFLNENREKKTYILITHYNRILHHLKPDYVLVIMDGQLKKVGDYKLAQLIEKQGYKKAV